MPLNCLGVAASDFVRWESSKISFHSQNKTLKYLLKFLKIFLKISVLRFFFFFFFGIRVIILHSGLCVCPVTKCHKTIFLNQKKKKKVP